MKRLLLGFVVLTLSALVASNALAQQRRGRQIRPSSDLGPTSEVGENLRRMWEEEKLARDVYASLAKTSELRMLQNIVRAENQHMQALERLIRTGGASVGALDDRPGKFVTPEYQQLHDSLIERGKRSPLDAFLVGAKIEEMDITDLKRLMSETKDPRVRQVLENLTQASHNHLRAFASQIANRGAKYEAEFLSQEEFDEIAASSGPGRGPKSAGRGGNGRGQGPWQGGSGGQRLRPRGPNPAGNLFGAQLQSRPGHGRQRRGR